MPISFDQAASIANITLRLEAMAKKAEAAVTAVCQKYSQQGAGYARENRPWTDRTGDARRSLHGYVVKGRIISARISHGVLYGISLEKKHGGRYAILPRVKLRYQAEFYEDIKAAVGGAVSIR